jgi:hypothetical protein
MLNNTVCALSAGMVNTTELLFSVGTRDGGDELFGRFSSDFHRLELAILTIQKKEPNVSV